MKAFPGCQVTRNYMLFLEHIEWTKTQNKYGRFFAGTSCSLLMADKCAKISPWQKKKNAKRDRLEMRWIGSKGRKRGGKNDSLQIVPRIANCVSILSVQYTHAGRYIHRSSSSSFSSTSSWIRANLSLSLSLQKLIDSMPSPSSSQFFCTMPETYYDSRGHTLPLDTE